MATIKSGMFDTEDELSNRRVTDMSERMYKLQPNEQQFRVMLSQVGSKEATREIVEWLEDEYVPRISAMAVTADASTATLTVTTGDSGTIFRPGSVVRNMESGEGYLVLTTPTSSTMTVTRGWGATPVAGGVTSSATARLMVVGNASAQGASSGVSLIVQKVRSFNYVQDQRNPMAFSDFETSIELYGGREPNEEIAKKMVEHGRDIENSLFWGAKDFNASASPGPMGSCGGALDFISTWNTTATSNDLGPNEFDTFLEGPFSFGSKNKAIFCAPRVATVLSQFLRDKWNPTTTDDRKYGAKVDAYVSGTYGWSIPIFVKREWADLGVAPVTSYGTYLFLIDMDYARIRFLRDVGNTRLRRGIQEPSSTQVVHEMRTCFSLEFAWEKAHGILKGITSYSATS